MTLPDMSVVMFAITLDEMPLVVAMLARIVTVELMTPM
jgi:hypothetical protein